MMSRYASRLLSALILLLCAVGCERRSAAYEVSPRDSYESVTNAEVSASEEDPSEGQNLSPEQRKVQEMRGYLDDGDYDRAIVLARDLMDSKDVSVRENVVLVLGWIGRRALPELTEMLRDPEPEIAQDALVAWENACEEYPSEKVRADCIAKSVKKIKDPAIVDAILMHFSSVDEDVALDTLSRIIEDNRGFVSAIRAKDMYEHIKGEIYDQPK